MKKLIIVMMLLVSSVCYASTNYDITGTWEGYFTVRGEYVEVTMELEQDGKNFSGSYETSTGGSGSVSVKIKGKTVIFTITEDDCTWGRCTGKGTLSKDESTIKFSFSCCGISCKGNSGSGIVAHISKNHCLHINSCSPIMRNLVDISVFYSPISHP